MTPMHMSCHYKPDLFHYYPAQYTRAEWVTETTTPEHNMEWGADGKCLCNGKDLPEKDICWQNGLL